MTNTIEYVPINTEISKKTHSELKDFTKAYKLRNMTLNYGFTIELALNYFFESLSQGKISLEDRAEALIKGD